MKRLDPSAALGKCTAAVFDDELMASEWNKPHGRSTDQVTVLPIGTYRRRTVCPCWTSTRSINASKPNCACSRSSSASRTPPSPSRVQHTASATPPPTITITSTSASHHLAADCFHYQRFNRRTFSVASFFFFFLTYSIFACLSLFDRSEKSSAWRGTHSAFEPIHPKCVWTTRTELPTTSTVSNVHRLLPFLKATSPNPGDMIHYSCVFWTEFCVCVKIILTDIILWMLVFLCCCFFFFSSNKKKKNRTCWCSFSFVSKQKNIHVTSQRPEG